MQIMSILWDNGRGMTTHEIIDAYPEPRPPTPLLPRL